MSFLRLSGLLAVGLIVAGCAGRAEIFQNSETALRHTAAEFAADSAKRFPYKADAPRGGDSQVRAQVGYWVNKLEVENLGETDWDDVEIWVNKSYVVWLPKLKAHPGKITAIPFQAIFNQDGHSFPTDNKKTLINTVEIYTGGKMYDVKVQLAD
jgi:hypothetical protein